MNSLDFLNSSESLDQILDNNISCSQTTSDIFHNLSTNKLKMTLKITCLSVASLLRGNGTEIGSRFLHWGINFLISWLPWLSHDDKVKDGKFEHTNSIVIMGEFLLVSWRSLGNILNLERLRVNLVHFFMYRQVGPI